MNPIRIVRRLACMLTGLAVALAATVAVAPAAFAQPHPPLGPPAEVVRFGPAAHTFNGVTGDERDADPRGQVRQVTGARGSGV